jgi:stage V sporulation protein S
MSGKEPKVIKVAGNSPVPQTAGSAAILIESGADVEMRAIGASAVNQAMKAAASARGMLAQKGYDILVRPGFGEIEENGEKRTIMKLALVKG